MCSAPIKKRPYYIDAPPYRRTSNGILILHRLWLNLLRRLLLCLWHRLRLCKLMLWLI